MEKHDDRPHAVLVAQLLRVAVGGLGLVEELEVPDAGRRHDVRRALQRHADEADLDAAELADLVGREQRLARVATDDVGGEEPEVRAVEAPVRVLAVPAVSVGWQPPYCIRSSSASPSSNSWLPTALRSSPIWFIASIVGSSWNAAESSGLAPIRSPAETTSEFGFVARERADVGRQVRGPAGVDRGGARRGRDAARAAGRRLQVAVEVVDGQQLHLDVARLGLRGGRNEKGQREKRRDRQSSEQAVACSP